MENVGDTDVVNPWLSNGRNSLRLRGDRRDRITPDMTVAEKAKALWGALQVPLSRRRGRRQRRGGRDQEHLHLRVQRCGSDAMMMPRCGRRSVEDRPGPRHGHCIAQVFYDGAWHLYDGDMKSMYLNRDNENVAGEQDIVRDHDLIKRTHSQASSCPIPGNQEWGRHLLVRGRGEWAARLLPEAA
jgi:hypothetical protein